MNLLSKVKRRIISSLSTPLIYDERLRQAYSSVSVTGGYLKGKNAVVTGATGGIGYAIARRLLMEGCSVIITGRNEEKLIHTTEKLNQYGKSVSYILLDQKKPEEFTQIVKKVFADSVIDLWVNCAGIFKKTDRSRKFRGLPKDTYFDVVDTNLKSTMLLNTLVADKMLENVVGGKIVNISSICGLTNHFGYTPYGISKTGVIEFTKHVSKKYDGKVIFISVAPGSVATQMGTRHFGGDISGTSALTYHVAIPEETAAVVCFLAGEAGNYLNGQTVVASAAERV